MTLKLSDLPEISFAQKDPEVVINEKIQAFEQAYFEETGIRKILRPGDPIRIFLTTEALKEIQLRSMIDYAGKQNLLRYSQGDALDHLGAFSRTERFEATHAITLMKITLSAARPTTSIIPAGTRISPDEEIYFEFKEALTIPSGETAIEARAYCLQAGEVGNGFTPGQINLLVDPIPWVESVVNIDTSSGGADRESNDRYRERIHQAPEGFSVAGPEGAYKFFCLQYSPLIEDVRVNSPSPGVVDIRVLLRNGELPTESFIQGLQAFLSDKKRRPLTDYLITGAPEPIEYDLDVTYYLSSEDVGKEDAVKSNVEQAIDEYILWQRSKIGRDINDSELALKARMAGAKRIVIHSPEYAQVQPHQLAVVGTKSVHYGGIEDE